MITLKAETKFVNRKGEVTSKLQLLSKDDPMYAKGFRFKDDQDRTYLQTGQFNIHGDISKYDLVRSLV